MRPAEVERQAPTIWFEVDDLIEHFIHHLHPSGIQRVVVELIDAALALEGARIGLCRLNRHNGRVALVAPPAGAAPGWHLPARRFWPRLMRRRALATPHMLVERWRGRTPQRAFERSARPGDMLLSFGAAWVNRHYGPQLARARRRHGLRVAVMVHDIIPVTHPTQVPADLVFSFGHWLRTTIPAADLFFTPSDHSGRALAGFCARHGLSAAPVRTVRFGAGFRRREPAVKDNGADLPERFALYVSTLEPRKNHRLLVDVWQRLIERHGADAVPTLLLVGQVRWGSRPLLDMLAASRFLGGKIVLMSDVGDAKLEQAYRRCLLTLFPSSNEGWGLPVAESLAHGKPCVAARATSVPEVGGDLVDYFDPADTSDAFDAIERALFEPGYLDARARRIVRDYAPPTWTDCARAILADLDAAWPADTPAPEVDA